MLKPSKEILQLKLVWIFVISTFLGLLTIVTKNIFRWLLPPISHMNKYISVYILNRLTLKSTLSFLNKTYTASWSKKYILNFNNINSKIFHRTKYFFMYTWSIRHPDKCVLVKLDFYNSNTGIYVLAKIIILMTWLFHFHEIIIFWHDLLAIFLLTYSIYVVKATFCVSAKSRINIKIF